MLWVPSKLPVCLLCAEPAQSFHLLSFTGSGSSKLLPSWLSWLGHFTFLKGLSHEVQLNHHGILFNKLTRLELC